MQVMSPEFESVCRACLDRYFAVCRNAPMQKRAIKALHLLKLRERPLQGVK